MAICKYSTRRSFYVQPFGDSSHVLGTLTCGLLGLVNDGDGWRWFRHVKCCSIADDDKRRAGEDHY
ncbi:hypothetical protein GCM10027184_39810 [Saccharothrix stipae]